MDKWFIIDWSLSRPWTSPAPMSSQSTWGSSHQRHCWSQRVLGRGCMES